MIRKKEILLLRVIGHGFGGFAVPWYWDFDECGTKVSCGDLTVILILVLTTERDGRRR